MSSVETTALQAGDRIELVSPDPLGWASRFDTVRSRLLTLLPKAEIEHIGSTSVPRLPAKDVVDVLVGVDPRQFSAAVNLLAANGFDFEGCREGHAWLSAPDRSRRDAVVHLVHRRGRQWDRRIGFRDTLREDATAKERYLEVKREAAAKFRDWGAYTAYKADVVAEILGDAEEQVSVAQLASDPKNLGP